MLKVNAGSGALVRGWAGMISFGILEQILLSGSSFAFTVIMARNLGAEEFGWFSIAWSIVMLLEIGAWGLFGDAAPSTAEKIPRTLWPEFRWSFLVLSAAFSGLLFCIDLAVALVIDFINLELAGLVLAIGVAFVALRLQNSLRRLYYLDGLRKEAAFAAVVNVATLFCASFLMISMGESSPVLALLCTTLASLASAALFLFQKVAVRTANRRTIVWVAARLWGTGRWLVVSSGMSWLGNFGVIPLIGIVLGVNSSGTLRAIQALVVPMTQVNSVLLSIIIPRLAAVLRRDRSQSWWVLATRTMLLLGGINGLYALCITIFGEELFPTLFGASAAGVTWIVIGLATFGYALESIRYGCNAVLLGTGATQILTIGQTAAFIAGISLIPLAAIWFGLVGVVGAMTAANNVGTLVVVIYFYWLVKKGR